MTISESRLRLPWILVAIWLFFVFRGVFYCAFLPMWEGYDEWSHFAYIEEIARYGKFLVDRKEPVSREVAASLEYVPVPWELRYLPFPSLTEDAYWHLPAEDRILREKELNAIPKSWLVKKSTTGPLIYEALQPPLYYWLLAGPDWLAKNESLADRVFLFRGISLFAASFSIFFLFLIVLRVTSDSTLALQSCAVFALMPELMIDVCRVGNECLGMSCFSWLTLVSLDLTKEDTPPRTGLNAGIALGLGLLSKAYFLTAVPALAGLYLWRLSKTPRKANVLSHALATFGLAALIAGWWYVHNRLTTGTWSGLNESIILVNHTVKQYFVGALTTPWRRGIDSILVSHIWFGGWSSLGLRSWMYHLCFWVVGTASVGVASVLWRSSQKAANLLIAVISIYGWFWLGQLFNVLLLFLSKGVATSMGWYMYCVSAAEVTLLVVGLHALTPARRWLWTYTSLIFLVASLDLYSVHFISIPYYTGLIAHQQNGAVASFHFNQLDTVSLSEVLGRLVVNKGSWVTSATIRISWLFYFISTVGVVVLPVGMSGRISRLR